MNIVLIALDTQRADHLGCYGYPKATSPFLDSIAADGVVFERCYAPNIPTHPSFTTLLTGTEAVTHNIVNIGGGAPIQDGIALLPEILKKHAWNTGAVDTMGRHFTRGFDHYVSPQWDRSEKPFFLFLHYWDPHTPYLPPAEFRTMFYPEGRDPYALDNHSMDPAWNDPMFQWYFHDWMPGVTDTTYVNALYDAETAYMDWQLRRVFAALEPIQEDTLVVVTADHGEILDEQLGFYDHHGLYEGNVHIPAIWFQPGNIAPGRVSGFIQNVDFVPTLLELAGLPAEAQTEGRSLVPCLRGESGGNYEELFLSEATWEVKRAVRDHRWKFIQSYEPDPHGRPMQELFDLESDPTEQTNLAESMPEKVAEMKARLDAWVAKRLAETGRTTDPVPAQSRCGTKIGNPVPGETPGAGATPLHLRVAKLAADIPAPDALNSGDKEAATNVALDPKTGTKLHGYVDKPVN